MGYGRFVGRVGALAVALGIGLAGPAVAAADPSEDTNAGESRTESSGAQTSHSGDGSAKPDRPRATEPADPSDDADEPVGTEPDRSVPEDGPDDTPVDREPVDEDRSSGLGDRASEITPDDTGSEPGGRDGDTTPSRSEDDQAVPTETETRSAELDDDTPSEFDGPGVAPEPPAPSGGSAAARGTAVDDYETVTVSSVPARSSGQTATVATGLSDIVAKFLRVLGIGSSAGDGSAPLPVHEVVTAVLGAIRREMDRLFANHGPSAVLGSTTQTAPGVVTGTVVAFDPEKDKLVYSVVEAPGRGTVTVDAAGNFVYTADTAAAGADTFVLGVRDTGLHLISVTPTRVRIPVTITFGADGVATQTISNRVAATSTALAATTATGTIHHVTTSGPDIVGFNPARDKLDLGDVSVHNFIVVDTAEGVGFRNPWSGETTVIQGVSLSQLTVDSFAPIINDHLRQDLSGALAWEQGITPKTNTVYARSHEVGQIDRVAFDAATDVVDFRYYGTREQLYMSDTPDGVVISNAGTGQALILQGVTRSQLTAKNFVFHSAQVREDRLHQQLGIGTVPDSQVLAQGVTYAGTNTWPTTAGTGQPPTGQAGTTTKISWQYGSHTTLNFDPGSDKLDFGWFKSHEFDVTEVAGSVKIAIAGNNQTYTLAGVAIGELTTSNIVALDDGTRTKWSNLIYGAGQTVSQPKLSVGDAVVSEGDSGTSTLTFTVTLSKASTDTVTVSYSTSNGSATAAGGDYVPAVGTLTFTPGQTSKTVAVTVNGDTLVEFDEQVTLTLSAPVNAAIADGTGVGTIRNDDVDRTPTTPPTVSIADLTVTEGNGDHSHFMFVATLSKPSTETVTVRYATSNGTATAGVDYAATTGTVTFAPGVTTQLVHVDVLGDTVAEQNETFFVTLTSPSGATIGDGVATGTITDDDTVVTPGTGGANSGNPGDALWGEAFFAPYVDMGAWPVPNLLALAQQRGISLLTLGFMQATPDGKLAWAGLSALTPDSDFDQAKAINQSIAALQAAGGDVMISLGGASGTSLAQWYAAHGLGARALADAYAAVADTYSLNRIDFDIEGSAVAEPASIVLNAQALRLLQQLRPDLEIWYTLPVLPSGLTADGLTVVRTAIEAGVKLDGVNIMAMDYGESAAPTSGPNAKTMGAWAIQAAESTYAQLTSLYAGYGQTFGWNQLGVTPMIGVNDVLTEVFTVADSQALEDFARARGLGMLSMWSLNRDHPGNLGQATTNTSGTNTPTGGFSAVFNDYGTVTPISGPPPAISIADVVVAEGNGTGGHAMFVVTLDKPSTQTVTVRYATSNGTAVAGADYAPSSGTVTFAPGVTSQTVHVGIVGDTVAESAESFTVTLSNPTGATIADGAAIGIITNDDGTTPTPGGNASVKYTVNDNWGSGFTASVAVTAGAAGMNGWTVEFDSPAQISNIWNAEIVSRVGNHYVVRNVSYNAQIAAGQTITFGFQASPGGGSATATNFTVNGAATGQPVVVPPKVSIADAAVVESHSGTKNMVFVVTLDKPATAPVSVAYATSNGTATAGADFTAVSGVVTFAAGVTSQQVLVPVLGDTTVEADETFTVTLSNPNGVTLADGSAIGTITNDDVATPTPGHGSATMVVNDNWGSGFTATVTVKAGSSALDGWTVEFDTPAQIGNIWNAEIVSRVGNHYVVRNAAWNPKVAAGQTVTFGFQASPGGGSASASNFTVNGQSAPVQAPTVSVADASVNESNTGATQMTFVVTLSRSSTSPVTVTYGTSNGTATAGVDYTAKSGTVTFAPGVLSQQIQVSVTGDTAVEANETFTLTLSNPAGATISDGSALGTIVNDDVAVPGNISLSISDASVTEGAAGVGVAPGWFATSGNQIVDSAGRPVQIAGVNWFGMESETFAPHGLWTRNYKEMMNEMAALDFNTIRLAYSSEMLHTTAAPNGIDFGKNPDLAGLSAIQIMDKIVGYAGEIGMRVILDHHRSSKGAGPNSNGLWYEGAYTEAAWIDDWKMLARRYATNPTVIGADLHNEPHAGTWGGGGATDWAAAAERAGNAVLSVNSNWLIFVEGVADYKGQSYWWGGNLMGVKDRPIVLNTPNRVVYSPHDYPNSVYAQPWFQTANFGAALPDKFEQMWGYIYEQNIAPIYLGEFGTRLSDPKDVIWYEAITSYLSGDFDNDGTVDIATGTEDMSWTFWSWNPNSRDTGGILADDWKTVNTNKMAYLHALQFDFDGGSSGVLAQFVVSLAAPSTQVVTVQYAASNGTAGAGSDYASTTGTLTFQPGETRKTITVVVFADTVIEGDETFLVTLSSPAGATLSDGSGTGTIRDRTIV